MWTEVLHEHVGVTHVAGQHVIWPICEDELTAREMEHLVRDAQNVIGAQAARTQLLEDLRAMRRDIEQKQHARQRCIDAGYDPEEVPL